MISLCRLELSIHFTLYSTSLDTIIDNAVHALHFCSFINHNSHPILQASCAEITFTCKRGIDEVTRANNQCTGIVIDILKC